MSDSRRFLGASLLILLSVGFAAAFIVRWPKPVSMVFAGISLLGAFGALLAFCKTGAHEYAHQARKAILLTSGCFGLAFIALALKYRAGAPALSLASLVAAVLLALGAFAAVLLTRSIVARP